MIYHGEVLHQDVMHLGIFGTHYSLPLMLNVAGRQCVNVFLTGLHSPNSPDLRTLQYVRLLSDELYSASWISTRRPVEA